MLNLKENNENKPNYLMENKIFGSCDICHKSSSFANRTCNKCFYKLIGEKNEM
ncbi:hypothetical protein [Spiroplasma endosymbiont of Colias croceus]|uniref:hypothetical protein n=1 Tax=Spiroplasma endosymbiont of Colias croceus TaxID=3066310 RepID=UPI0030CEAA48